MEKTPSRQFNQVSDDQQRPFSWLTFSACLWLGLFPLLHLGSYSTLTRDKGILMFLLLFVTILSAITDGIHHQLKKPSAIPVFLAGSFLCWIIVSCLCSKYSPDIWWYGASARKEGLLTQLCYLLLFFCFVCSSVRPIPILCSASSGIIVYFIIVLLQRSGFNPFDLYPGKFSFQTSPAFQGPIGNVDMVAGYLSLITGLCISFLWKSISERNAITKRFRTKKKYTVPVVVVGLFLSVYLILTIDVNLAVFTLVATLLFVFLSALPKRFRLAALLIILALIFLLIWFWPAENDALWEIHEILHDRTQLSFGGNRVAVWNYSLLLAKENLLFGGGSDTFEPRFNDWLKQNNLIIPQEQNAIPIPDYFDNPHNEYLAHLVNHGLPAMLLFFALLLSAVFHPRYRKSAYRLAVYAYAVQACFSFSVCITAPMFWVVLGLCYADNG